MVSYKQKINQIRLVLGLEVKMAKAKLEDGTVIEADSFAPGDVVYIIAEDGSKKAAPEGVHKLDDGSSIEVNSKGEIIEAEDKSTTESEGPDDTEMDDAGAPIGTMKKFEDEMPAEIPTAMSEKIVDDKIGEAMNKVAMAMEPIAKDVAEIKAKLAEVETKYAKFAKAPAAGKITKMNEEVKTSFDEAEARIARFNELKNSFK
jgi:hypothetical protein